MLHSDRHLENALSTLIWLTVIILFLITTKGAFSNTSFLSIYVTHLVAIADSALLHSPRYCDLAPFALC